MRRYIHMTKTLETELPIRLSSEVDALIDQGWFANTSEIVNLALADFVRRYHFVLIEKFQEEDIDWALQQHQHQDNSVR